MSEGAANRTLRRTLWWSIGLRVSGVLILMLLAASGVHLGSTTRLLIDLTLSIPLLLLAALLAAAYRRHRRAGLLRRAAARAVVLDAVPLPLLKLMAHEVALLTSTLRWLTRRPRHGVHEGDTAVPYASGGALTMFALIYASAIETVALGFIIPWPVVRITVLVVDLWGVYFAIALYASCVVRPHVVHADGSVRLRYGALLDIRIPAQAIVEARVERRQVRGKLATVDERGCAALSQGGQTTVTVELATPVAFSRPLGKRSEARVFRYYADDPASAVAATRRSATTARAGRG